MFTFQTMILSSNCSNKIEFPTAATYLLLLMLNVLELMAGGTARRALSIQMRDRMRRAVTLLVRGCRGDMMARLLSSVMANMVNTEAGTEQREMNWLKEQ